jgi:predicted metal-dependent hydrolase
MAALLDIVGVEVRVVRKDVRNLHLSVLPPDGAVRVTAPEWMGEEAIRLFALGKLGWIKRQRGKMRGQERELAREYVDRESHYVWGQRYLLQIVEQDAPPRIEIRHRKLVMRVRPDTDRAHRDAILYDWYRNQLRRVLPPLLDRWAILVGARPERIHIQRMKTKWGSCNPDKGSIRLNTELAKKPPECLDYILLHELVHLREPTHGAGFIQTMNRLMPQWQDRRDALNRLPIRSE